MNRHIVFQIVLADACVRREPAGPTRRVNASHNAGCHSGRGSPAIEKTALRPSSPENAMTRLSCVSITSGGGS